MNLSEIIYWENIAEIDSASNHKSYQHKKMFENLSESILKKEDFTDIQYWRFKVIDIFESVIDKKISGKCMEIGSGKGLSSAYLTSMKNVDKVYALDYSLISLKELLPKACASFSGFNEKKIERVFGSFDNIKDKNFDFIFAFGAMHNSSDLFKSYESIYNSLNEGGFFMSSDMCLPIHTNKYQEDFLTNSIVPSSKSLYGKDLKYKDTNDYFRNMVDYIYYAKEVGFNVYPIFFTLDGVGKIPKIQDFNINSSIQNIYPSGKKGQFDKLLIICEKKDSVMRTETKNLQSSYFDYISKTEYFFILIKKIIMNPYISIKKIISKLFKI